MAYFKKFLDGFKLAGVFVLLCVVALVIVFLLFLVLQIVTEYTGSVLLGTLVASFIFMIIVGILVIFD